MNALHALFHTLQVQPSLIPEGRILFLRAQAHPGLEPLRERLTCEQPWKPRANGLEAAGIRHTKEVQGQFPLVLLLPERQRESILADFARAYECLAEGGTLVVALHNDWGAKRMEQHLRDVAGEVSTVSKNHCRVFWTTKTQLWQTDVLETWRTAGALQRILEGRFWSQPGLFNWNEIDEGSRLLTEHLPHTLHGAVADLGCSWGYLSDHILRHAPKVRSLDAYEADATALEAARRNLGLIPTPIKPRLRWHDVAAGLNDAVYDAVVMNPPFHDGRDAEPLLGVKFITAAAQSLKTHGHLWLVANKHLPYENVLKELFLHSSTIIEARGFKILHAAQPNPSLHQKSRRPRRER